MITPLAPVPPDENELADEIFHEALQRGPADREAYLIRVSGADTALRVEVEGMLRDHERAGGLLGGEAPMAGELAAASLQIKAESAGARIDPDKLVQQIREGGCGVVWWAHDGLNWAGEACPAVNSSHFRGGENRKRPPVPHFCGGFSGPKFAFLV